MSDELKRESERLLELGLYYSAAAKLQAALDEAHAKIDALMLEYCPDEMTPKQKARWAANQGAAMERQS